MSAAAQHFENDVKPLALSKIITFVTDEDMNLELRKYSASGLFSRGVTCYMKIAQLNGAASTIVVRNYSPPFVTAA